MSLLLTFRGIRCLSVEIPVLRCVILPFLAFLRRIKRFGADPRLSAFLLPYDSLFVPSISLLEGLVSPSLCFGVTRVPLPVVSLLALCVLCLYDVGVIDPPPYSSLLMAFFTSRRLLPYSSPCMISFPLRGPGSRPAYLPSASDCCCRST